jgi:hypothetical protein
VLPGFDTNFPVVSKCVEQFYNQNVTAAGNIKCENTIPIRMVAAQSLEDTVKTVNEQQARNDWSYISSLPSELNAEKILKDMVNNEMNSQQTK